MFQKIRKHIEKLYDAKADVYGYEEYKQGALTKHKETQLYSGIPCRLSYGSSPNTVPKDTAAANSQTIKLFLAPEYKIPAGCKITVTNKGSVVDYKSSGQPMMYDSHQEIELEMFKRWA